MKNKALREEFARVQREALDVVEAAGKESRELTAEEKEANDKRFTRLEQIKKLDDEEYRFAELSIRAAMDGNGTPAASGTALVGNVAVPGGTITFPQDAPGREEYERNRQTAEQGRDEFAARPGETTEQRDRRVHRDVVNNFIRTGQQPDKRFTLITTTGSGVLVPSRVGPPTQVKRQRNPIRAALQARGVAPIRTDGMESLTIPIFDDTANLATVIAQNATGDNPLDPTLTGLTLAADLRDSGTIWSSNTLIKSAGFDLMGYLEPMLGARIEQRESLTWITSLQGATVGKTTASATGVTYAELLDWQHSIPLLDRGDGVFIVSDGLFRVLRGLVDTTGQPIFQRSLTDDAPDTLLGWPIFVDANLPTPAINAVTGIAASASRLVVRDVNNRRIARYADQPNWPDQVGIRMFENGGFNFVPSGVRTLKQAAA